jgi:hypothetical protein
MQLCLLFWKSLSSVPAFLRSLHKISGARKFEVRVFDRAQNVAERIEGSGGADSFADVLNVCAFSCTER